MKTIRPLLFILLLSAITFQSVLGEEWVTLTTPPQDFDFVDPCISPDGNFLAFTRGRTLPMVASRAIGGGWQSAFLPISGTAEILWPAVSRDGLYAAFSQGGTNILFYTDPFGTPQLVDLKSACGEDTVFDPSFTPCGKYLYFAAKTGGTGSIYRKDLETGTMSRLYQASATLFAPSANSGGTRFVFGRYHSSEGYTIWSKRENGLTQLAEEVSKPSPIYPVISGDGAWVAFQQVKWINKVSAEGGEVHEVSYLGEDLPENSQRVAINTDGSQVCSAYTTGDPHPRKTVGATAGRYGYVHFAHAYPASLIVSDSGSDRLNIFVDGPGTAAPLMGTPSGVLLSQGDPGSGQEAPSKISLPIHSVNVATLDLVLKGTLFHYTGWGVPVNITMTYNNSDSWNGEFGPRWSMNYDTACSISEFGVSVRKGSGEIRIFQSTNANINLLTSLTGEISLPPPTGVTESLRISNTNIVRTRLSDLITFHYTRFSGDTARGWLTAIEDRNGNRIMIQRSAADHTKIFTIDDANGQLLSFNHAGPNGQCSQIYLLGNGRTIQFSYDAGTRRLTRITDMAGNTAQYSYDTAGNLSMVRNGMPVQYTDDESSMPAGTPVRTAQFSYRGGEIYQVRENSDDPVLYERVSGDPGKVRRTSRGQRPFIYGSNLEQKIEQFTDPLGNSTLIGYTSGMPTTIVTPKGENIKIEYNSDGFPEKVTDALGNISRYEYKPGTGLVTRYTPPGHNTAQSWVMQYDAKNNLTAQISPLGYTNRMTYGTKGELLTTEDPAGNITEYTYTDNGKLSSVKRPGDTTGVWLYWDNFSTGRDFQCTRMYDPEGRYKTFTYDNNDRLTNVCWKSASGQPTVRLQWDAFHQTTLTDALGGITRFEHNLFGLRTKTTSPLNQIDQAEYDVDNRLQKTINPLNRITTRIYDDTGRLTKIQKPIGESTRTYDKEGHLTSYQTPKGGVTSYSYDKNGRRTQTAPQGMSPVNFTYTGKGELATIVNARGQTISHTYDLDGQLTSRTIPGTGQDTFSYNSRGLPTSMTSADGISGTYIYDSNGRVSTMQWPRPGGGTFTASFQYDQSDQLTQLIYPDGTVVNYIYDGRCRVELPSALRNAGLRESVPPEPPLYPLSVVWSNTALTGTVWSATTETDLAARPVRLWRTNGVSTAWGYDPAGRTTNLQHSAGTNGLFAQSILYNADDTTARMELTPDIDPGLTPALLNAGYDAQDRLTSFGGSAPSYDADGNCTTAPNGRFNATYDALNRLRSITRDGNTRTFFYDAKDRLAGWTEGPETRYLYRDTTGRILFECNGNGDIVALTVYHGNRPLARGLPSTGWTWFHFDRNGNTTALSDDNGEVIARYTYLPFGQYQVSGTPGDNDRTYGGAYGVIDHGGGIFHMGRRTYDTGTRRFLQRDPIGFEGGDNLYAYAGGNPVDYVDPDGTFAFIPALAAVAGTYLIIEGGRSAWNYAAGKVNKLMGSGKTGEERMADLSNAKKGDKAYKKDMEQGKNLVKTGAGMVDLMVREVAQKTVEKAVEKVAPVKPIFKTMGELIFGGEENEDDGEGGAEE